MRLSIIATLLYILFYGCATTKTSNNVNTQISPPNDTYVQRGYGIQYYSYRINIISEPPGAKIEWNNDYIGETPISTTFNGYYGIDGVPSSITIIAYPNYPGQYKQVKIISTNEIIPRKIYFDMKLQPRSYVPSEQNTNDILNLLLMRSRNR